MPKVFNYKIHDKEQQSQAEIMQKSRLIKADFCDKRYIPDFQ